MAPPAPDPFPSTCWSVVLRAGEGQRAALAELCAAYWEPLYGFVRRRGLSEADAQDAVQGFLARFLERGDVARVDTARGRFRAYLLAGIKNHLAAEHRRRGARKRGGGLAPLSLDWERAERRFHLEPADERTAEEIYERQWALSLLERAAATVRADYAARGQQALFDAIGGALTGDDIGPYTRVAEHIGLTEGAVKVAVHRLRGRFKEALQREVAATVDDMGDVDNEIRHLMRALGH